LSVLTSILEKRSKESGLSNPEQWLTNAFGRGSASKAGATVTEDTAMQIMAVYACVRLKSETIASLPLNMFKKRRGGKEKAEDHPLYFLLHDIPNPEQTSFEFRQMMQVCKMICGESFAEIVRDPITLNITELWPIPNNYVTPYYYTDTKKLAYYRIALPNGGTRDLYPEQMWHWKGLARDRTKVFKPCVLAREALGLAISAEEYGERFFSNGTNVGGVIEYANAMDEAAAKRFRESIREKYQGLGNSNRLIFLEQGSKFTAVNVPNDQAQFIDTRKFQVIEICRFFNISPDMIHDLERATFSNIEQQSIKFVVYSIRPELVCIEQSAYKDLLLPGEQKKYFFKFNVDALLRGDFKTRMDGYAVAIQNGIYSQNQVLELEDMETFEGGDIHMVNGNMIPVSMLEKWLNAKLNKLSSGKGGNSNAGD
jgi:HK97 family phage portal protein